MILQFRFFLVNAFSLLFIHFWLFQISMTAFSYFVSSFMHKSQTAVYVGFIVFLVSSLNNHVRWLKQLVTPAYMPKDAATTNCAAVPSVPPSHTITNDHKAEVHLLGWPFCAKFHMHYPHRMCVVMQVGWMFQTVVIFGVPYNTTMILTESGKAFYWVFNFFPWDPLTKGVLDLASATNADRSPGKQ